MVETLSTTELQQAMKRSGLNQAEIALAVGCSQGQVSKVLKGLVAEDSKISKQITQLIIQRRVGPSPRGKAILDRLISECWDGTTQQALAIDGLVRSALRLSEKGVQSDGK